MRDREKERNTDTQIYDTLAHAYVFGRLTTMTLLAMIGVRDEYARGGGLAWVDGSRADRFGGPG